MPRRGVDPPASESDTPGFRTILTLTAEEARHGCTRMVDVEGRQRLLRLPAGVEDGEALRFPNRGLPDEGRDELGDLIAELVVMPPPGRGADLSVRHSIPAELAAAGGKFVLEVGGRHVWVRIPPGASDGQVVRVPGEGGDGERGGDRGDLLLLLSVGPGVDGSPATPARAASSGSPEIALVRAEPRDLAAPGSDITHAVEDPGGDAVVLSGGLDEYPKRRGSRRAGLAVTGVLAALAGTGILTWRGAGAARPRPAPPPAAAPLLVEVCSASGLLPAAYCPTRVQRSFATGPASPRPPAEQCSLHQGVTVRICGASGLVATAHCPGESIGERRFPPGAEPRKDCPLHVPASPRPHLGRPRAAARLPKPAARVLRKPDAPSPSRQSRPARARFCGACGAQASGGFCGGCGRRL